MPKPNYHQARKQRELAKKTRQQAKLERRSTRPSTPDTNTGEAAAEPATSRDPVPGDGV